VIKTMWQTSLGMKTDSGITVCSSSVCAIFETDHRILRNFIITNALSKPEDEWTTLPSGIDNTLASIKGLKVPFDKRTSCL
jgi:hypothetical protein